MTGSFSAQTIAANRENTTLEPEVAIWWSLTITVAIGRYILRATRKGLRFDAADWLMLLALFMITLTLSLLNISRYGFDNLPGFSRNISPSSLDLDPKSTRLWKTYGILAWTGEICNITTQYLVKGCLLLVYHSLTRNRKTNIVNKVVAGIVVIGYFLIIILFLAAWCHPLEAYWTPSLISDGHRACFTFIPHNITVLVVNTVTDLLVLAVPIPMIWKVKVSHLRRFFIIAIFGIGIFSIVACICARSALLVWQHYNNNNQLQINFNRNYVVWMAREVSSAVIVGNLYYYVPLIKMIENWVSGLRMKRASYRQAESPDIEQTPRSDMEEGG
ncbi:hypothetical protein TWF192_010591 [Orbilia oligospora]|uniref:Rhodopsin domain-containing protein n=1 Tax=Orbilia oligospora TaxID=2813651 RepID=A0A6G1MIE5_ORBOL|nr:hypothetical protein TWF191_005042 [Orbilia oligospora]KAF3259736.1 hypothetical protein TWF192_010591 [Orbilia oligospora]